MSCLVKTCCSVLLPFRCSTDNIIRLTFLFIQYTASTLAEHTPTLWIWFSLWTSHPTLKTRFISFYFSACTSTDYPKVVSGSLQHGYTCIWSASLFSFNTFRISRIFCKFPNYEYILIFPNSIPYLTIKSKMLIFSPWISWLSGISIKIQNARCHNNHGKKFLIASYSLD